jgi:hypothetical protein
MGTAERYSELIARLAAERLRLHLSKMMRVGWLAATNETCLLGHVTQVLAVAVPAWCSNREGALVDALGQITSGPQGLRLVLKRHRWRGTLGCGGVG